MPDLSFVASDATTQPAFNKSRGYRYLAVDFATRRISHEFKFSSVQYTFQRNLPGEFGAVMDLYDPNARKLVPQESFLVVERLGQPFWCGFLWQPTRSGKNLNIAAQEVFSIFGHRHIRVTKDWINQDRGFMLRDLFNYGQQGAGGPLGISVGSETVGGTPTSLKIPWWENKTIAEAVDTIVSMNPSFSFRVVGEWQPGNVLGFRLVIDPVHPVPTPHKLVYGGNVVEYEWQPLSPSPNFIDGFGGFDNEAMIRRSAQNDDALLRQPRIESSIEDRNLFGEEGVVNLAVNQLKRLSGSPSQPSVTMIGASDPQLGVLRPGHACEVSILDGYVHVEGSFNVEKISVSVPDGAADAPGAEIVKLDFDSKLDDELVTVS